MTTEHTPVTAEVREGFAFYLQGKFAGATFGQGLSEFDAWLVQHDAELWERGWLTVSVDHRDGVGDINPISGEPIAACESSDPR